VLRSDVWIDQHPASIELTADPEQITLTVDGHTIEIHRSRWMELLFQSIIDSHTHKGARGLA